MLTDIAAGQECNLIYALNSVYNKHEVINRDTIFLGPGGAREVYFINDRFYRRGKVVYRFTDVQYYAEISSVLVNGVIYVYCYPVYNGQVGPYIWELSNGVVIRLSTEGNAVRKKFPYADFFSVSELDFPQYFKSHYRRQRTVR